MKALKMLPMTALLLSVAMMAQHTHPQAAKQQASGSEKKPATAAQLPAATVHKIGSDLVKNFDAQPISPGLPDHVWMKTGDNTVQFLHFMKPVNSPGNKLVFIGDGVRGKFCAENQPEQGKTGYVHFHSLQAEPGHAENEMMAMGHGGKPGQEGYWLRHIAVSEFDMMGQHFTPGIAMNFMGTPPPKCGQ